ncbi:polyprenyl synthetase family protein [Kitasatospora sp. NPDC058046]|uniref:polyprenyl synthetase family protein n=1 Tax=Kitasatospora sp. NPDC058046 TaxID=3346312 RepID=UPI0036DCB140
MTASAPPPTTVLDLDETRQAVDACLAGFLSGKALTAAQGAPDETVGVLRRFLFSGGKRLRPLLCVCGWRAAGGQGDTAPVVQAAASLEMFHTFALIHDDIMDHSATRRGAPAVHRAMAARYRRRGRTASQELGTAAAILIGDIALAWSDELLHTAGLPLERLAAALPTVDTMRTEVMYGQYLDLLATADFSGGLDVPLTVMWYKAAKYTVERPLHIGATIAGANASVLEAMTSYALPLGEAFQLRDDLLGVYGDPRRTGKSALDDLREGKHTVLVALALRNATPDQRALLRRHLGDPALNDEDAARVREVLTATGARSEVERMIRRRGGQAHEALLRADFPHAVTRTLHGIVGTATWRTS